MRGIIGDMKKNPVRVNAKKWAEKVTAKTVEAATFAAAAAASAGAEPTPRPLQPGDEVYLVTAPAQRMTVMTATTAGVEVGWFNANTLELVAAGPFDPAAFKRVIPPQQRLTMLLELVERMHDHGGCLVSGADIPIGELATARAEGRVFSEHGDDEVNDADAVVWVPAVPPIARQAPSTVLGQSEP